jgi:hypothetical protein
MVEAARIMGFVPRVVEQLSTVKESLAFHMVGNAVPVETFGAIIAAMVEMWQIARTMTESSSAEVVDVEVQSFSVDWHGDEKTRAWYPGCALESSASQKKMKKESGKKADEPKPWMVPAQWRAWWRHSVGTPSVWP